jgi:hypothetical protein
MLGLEPVNEATKRASQVVSDLAVDACLLASQQIRRRGNADGEQHQGNKRNPAAQLRNPHQIPPEDNLGLGST